MCLQTFIMFLMYMQVHLHFFWIRSFFMLDNMLWPSCCGNSQLSWPCLCILQSELRQDHVIFSLNPCLYMSLVFLLVMLEAAVAADVILNRDWEEAMSLFLAMILRALGPDSRNDSDDEYLPARLPLLRNQVQHAPYVGDPSAPIPK
ncbi:hypothetical protein BHE74_00037450 [Ensete ventricosum]|nr:hypothetical protein BHE74_00037450 [Ensete ventricosum]